MIEEIADIRILPGTQAEFEEAVERGLRTVHTRAQGMRGYKLSKCIETPERYVLEVRWDSVEDHMVTYRGSPLSPELSSSIGPLPVRCWPVSRSLGKVSRLFSNRPEKFCIAQ